MATSYVNGTISYYSSPDASIKDWPGKIENLLSIGGWIQTSDTGQTLAINMTAATSGNQVRGYQIWRMADSLQSTSPVFMKLEFCSGAGATQPTLKVTIGSGSDGAGNITTVYISQVASYTGATGSGAASFIGSASTNRICFYIGVGSGGQIILFVERTKDTAGADTSDGVLAMLESYSIPTSALNLFKLGRSAGNNPVNSTNIGAFVPSGSSWSLGTNIGVCPIRFFDGMPTNPCKSALVYMHADIAELSTIQVSIYGVSRTYFTLGTTKFSSAVSGNVASSMMLLYE